MPATCVWIDSITPDNQRLLVWKKECFYSAKISNTDQAAWEEELHDVHDPSEVLGPECQVAPIQLVTRIEYVLGNQARIYYGKNGTKVIQLLIVTDGQKFLDAVKESRPDWQHDLHVQNRFIAALKAFGLCLFLAAVLALFYVLIEFNIISQAHWLIALIVNLAGTMPLLILSVIFVLLGLVVGSYSFARPSETHVLRPGP